ncbi:MAG: amidohydrolase [Eubacteriales bacterium]|nr:amidohydrolase [Eubacteriales bacterium]MDD4389245.1 amidohydrolase [Eubacteriales bacterium]
MFFRNITILNENFEIRRNMYVGIKDDKIDYIGEEIPDNLYGYIYNSEIYDGEGKLMMPAFYNAHTHSPMTLMRGYGEGLELQDWLEKKIFPFEDKLDGNAVYWATLLAIAEGIAGGVVSSTDMYYFCDDEAKAVIESGAKMNISRSIVHLDDSNILNSKRFREMESFIKEYHGTGMRRVLADVSLHAEYTNTEESCKALAKFASYNCLNMAVHMSETKKEHEECKARHGMTPAAFFEKCGVFNTKATAAHCVWLEDSDFEILRKNSVTVATCPVSNMKLASGIAGINKMLDMRINVALGTDSVASNNSLDMFEEMKIAALCANIKIGNPAALSPKQVLYMATRAGALSQGRERCGLIKQGFKADLQIIDIDKPNLTPVHDMRVNLVYSAHCGDVVLTMSDGKVLYKDGEFMTIDIEKVRRTAKILTENILGEL